VAVLSHSYTKPSRTSLAAAPIKSKFSRIVQMPQGFSEGEKNFSTSPEHHPDD